MINDHRLGFPPVLLALDPEPRKSLETPRRPRLSEEEQAARRLLDVAPPTKTRASHWTYCYSMRLNLWRRYSDKNPNIPTEYWYPEKRQWTISMKSLEELKSSITTGFYVIQACPFAT